MPWLIIRCALVGACLLATAQAWCSPTDTEDCTLTIRAGREVDNSRPRSIQFVNRAHEPAAMLRVQPNRVGARASTILEVLVGGGTQSKTLLTLNATGGETTVHKTLLVKGSAEMQTSLSVKGEIDSKSTVRAISTNGANGAALSSTGSLEIFAASGSAHVDLKMRNNEDFAVRALQMNAKNDLYLHGHRMLVSEAGRVGIGVDAPSHPLHVNGVVRAASSTITTGSDERIKQLISDMNATEALAKIRGLRPRKYHFKEPYADQMGTSRGAALGFVAQEVAAVIPEAVSIQQGVSTFTSKAGNLSVEDLRLLNMEPILVNLIAAVQQLSRQVDELQSRCPGLE